MTISPASDFEIELAICKGVVSYDFTILIFPSGKVTVISSRGRPTSTVNTFEGRTCDIGLVFRPMFIKHFDTMVDEFRTRRNLIGESTPGEEHKLPLMMKRYLPSYLSFYLSFVEEFSPSFQRFHLIISYSPITLCHLKKYPWLFQQVHRGVVPFQPYYLNISIAEVVSMREAYCNKCDD